MRRSLLAFLIAAAACGGKQKSTTPPPPLPETKAEAKPAEPPKGEEKPKEEKPPVPTGPVELTFEAPKVTVKLVNAGKGKKAALKLTPKAGDKQSLDLTLDFAGKQELPPEYGGKVEQVTPTIVLSTAIEAKEVGADGATKFNLTINGIDAKDAPGSKTPAAELKTALGSLTTATIEGSVKPNGSMSDMTLKLEKPDQYTADALSVLKIGLLPLWPVFPTEAIGPGAKWQVSSTSKVADRVEVTQTTDYEVVAHKGKTWTIKGTTKVTGNEQSVSDGPGKATFGGIGGSGTVEATFDEGTLVPGGKQSVKTDFTVTAEQDTKKVAINFHLEQANAVTPKQ